MQRTPEERQRIAEEREYRRVDFYHAAYLPRKAACKSDGGVWVLVDYSSPLRKEIPPLHVMRQAVCYHRRGY